MCRVCTELASITPKIREHCLAPPFTLNCVEQGQIDWQPEFAALRQGDCVVLRIEGCVQHLQRTGVTLPD